MAFPEEVTDQELAFDIAQESWDGLKKDIKSDSKVEIKSLKIAYDEEYETWQHTFKFDGPAPAQLLGMLTTCLEVVANREIVEFVPSESKLIISYADVEPEENDQD